MTKPFFVVPEQMREEAEKFWGTAADVVANKHIGTHTTLLRKIVWDAVTLGDSGFWTAYDPVTHSLKLTPIDRAARNAATSTRTNGDDMDQTKIEACARAAHETNRAYCIGIGDHTQMPWDDAPDWQRERAINGVIGVINGNGPEESHESWLKEKAATGWTYGTVKDPDLKTHPCFVPYGELPPEQKAKDAVYVAVVTAMATALCLMPEQSTTPMRVSVTG